MSLNIDDYRKHWEDDEEGETPIDADELNRHENGFIELILHNLLFVPENNIASGTDLNSINSIGTYKCSTSAIATSLSNCPHKNSAFKLIVMAMHDVSRLTQIIVANDTYATVFMRNYSVNGWTDWQTIVNKTILDNMIGLGTTTTKGIPNSQRINAADFNEIDGTGFYIGYNGCTNAPTGNGEANVHWYIIQIEHNSNYKVQLAYWLTGATQTMYKRLKVNGTWQEWLPKNLQNSNITIKTGKLATNASYKSQDGHVFLNLKITAVTINSTASSTVLLTLPSDFRPSSEVSIVATTNTGVTLTGWIRTTGELVVHPYQTISNSEIRIVSVY